MAAGAVRLECRELPAYSFRIALMAHGALKIAEVVKRFIRKPRVAVVNGGPGIRVVTQSAVRSRIEVPGVLACCERTVVA